MRLHFTNEWLKKMIEEEPDGMSCEAGLLAVDPTTIGDCIADEVRLWYEANRETWWERRKRRGGVADEFMLALINEVHRVESSLPRTPVLTGERMDK